MIKTNEQLAYAAGIFDVRGGIYLQPNKNSEFRTLRIKLVLIRRKWAVLEYLHAKFGGTITNASDDRKEWVVVGGKALDFLKSIEPWIITGKRKKQISFLKRRYRAGYPGRGGYTTRLRKQKLRTEEAWTQLI